MLDMNKPIEKIIIDAGINVWDQEIETAQAFAVAGKTVKFLKRNEDQRRTSADVEFVNRHREITRSSKINVTGAESLTSSEIAVVYALAKRPKGMYFTYSGAFFMPERYVVTGL